MRAPLLVVTAVVFCATAHAAGAQKDTRRALSLGLVGGASFPVGRWSSSLERAPHAAAVIEVRSPYAGVALRFEGTYDSFRMPSLGLVSDSVGGSLGVMTGSMRLLGGTANVVLRAPHREAPVRGYVIGGVGVFRVQSHTEAPGPHGRIRNAASARTRSGINAGLGVEGSWERVTAFAELRYHYVRGVFDSSPLRMMPLNLGLALRRR